MRSHDRNLSVKVLCKREMFLVMTPNFTLVSRNNFEFRWTIQILSPWFFGETDLDRIRQLSIVCKILCGVRWISESFLILRSYKHLLYIKQ